MVSSLVIVLHDKFRHPVSTRQNDWKSSIITPAITPNNSIIVEQGLSVINWLFFGIGFPELKAAYPSRKAWRCAKRTISSSAPFISSGCSSILAFLLSLSRMLCSTLLTLACTRTKRVQLEYRFGSSLHTHGVLFCFDAVSF